MNEDKKKQRKEYMRLYMNDWRKKNPEKVKQIRLAHYRKMIAAENTEDKSNAQGVDGAAGFV